MANQAEVDLVVNAAGALPDLERQLSRIVQTAESGAPDISLETQLDRGSVADLQTSVSEAVQTVERTAPDIEVDIDVDEGQLRRATRLVQGLGRTATTSVRGVGALTGGVAALSLGAGGLVNTLAAVAAAAQQIAPAAAVGTSALLTLKLATGTLQLAMIGVEEAITNAFDPDATPEELEKSLSRLAPEARKVVTELRDMRGELSGVQQGVQNRVFQDFDEILRSLATEVGPEVTGALNRTADSLNAMGRNAATAATQLSEQGVLGQALTGATSALENLEQVPARVARSFGFLAAASSPALNRIALAVDDVSLKIQNKLQRAFESGDLERAIDGAVSAIAQLGTTLGNFGSGVSNIFSGLTQDGGGLFDILEKVSEAFKRLTENKEFQKILGELSKTADTLVENALPLIEQAFITLGPVIEKLAPVVRDFIEAIGPELVPIIEKMGPILVDIAEILEEQLPNAIVITETILRAFGIALDIVHGILENFVLPAIRKVNEFLESDFIKTIQDVFNTVTDSFPKIADEFANLRDRANDAINGMIQVVGNLIGKLRDALVDGIISVVDEAISEFLNLRDGIVNALSGLPGQMFGIGVNIIDGLTGGILSQVGSLISTAKSIANSISSTISDALDIHSPSRVTRELGKNVVDGLIKGMLDKRELLEDTAEALAKVVAANINPTRAITNTAQAAIPLFTGKGTSVVNVIIDGKIVRQIVNDQMRTTQNQLTRTYAMGVRL